jgi:hypothetical protein
LNAGHFLLAKKLKLQEDPGYETESMRTALYFNNPFWLQSLLDDGNHLQSAESFSRVKEAPDEDQFIFEDDPEETADIIQTESNYTFESYTPIEQPVTKRDELDEETEEILEEKENADPVRSEDTFQYAEPGTQTVTSFDELMAKYNIQPLDMVDETAAAPEASLPRIDEVLSKSAVVPDFKSEAVEPEPPKGAEAVHDLKLPDAKPEPDKSTGSVSEFKTETAEPEPNKSTVSVPEFKTETAEPEPDHRTAQANNRHESLEEVVNEYGVFEELVAKKTDHDEDMDAFDEPLDQIPFVSDKIVEETIPADHSVSIVITSGTEPIVIVEDAVSAVENTAAGNTRVFEYDNITENQESEDAPHQTDEHDYDAYDRPPGESAQIEITENESSGELPDNQPPEESVRAEVTESESSNELSDYDPDNTGEPTEYSDDSETGANGQMHEMSERFEEQQKSLSAFNAKNADSIVFTPYHMVDYFASQGIKLVLEDNPPDQFGKQLKSFTDWLKVMKKIPNQHPSGKEDEKVNEQIRHFAAHSIEERDVLTESMAEVLAKQGMYENAIALYQKLSLIYPPKSAYFASRIEQLKASLS